MTSDPTEFRRLANDLVAQVNVAYGLYLDSTAGFRTNVTQVDAAVRQSSGTTDDSLYHYGEGSIGSDKTVLHTTTVGAFRERNSDGGRNYLLLAQYIIVILYEQWEHTFRDRIADAAGLPQKDDLKVSVFGDLRHLRHEILHTKGRLSDEVRRKLEVIRFRGDLEFIDPTPNDVNTIIMAVKTGLDMLVGEHTGVDPGYRMLVKID